MVCSVVIKNVQHLSEYFIIFVVLCGEIFLSLLKQVCLKCILSKIVFHIWAFKWSTIWLVHILVNTEFKKSPVLLESCLSFYIKSYSHINGQGC